MGLYGDRRTSPLLRGMVAAVLTLFAVLALAACGGGSSSTSSSTASPESAETGSGETETTASGSEGGTESGGSGEVAEAQAAAEEAMQPPTEWEGPTEPVKALKGLKLAAISCDAKLGGCTETVKSMQKVAEEELGWSVKFYDGQSNPKVWNEDIIQAVNEGVDAIGISSMDPLLIQQGLAEAEKAGIPVINSNSAGWEPNPVTPSGGKAWPFAGIDMSFTEAGEASADWVIADSGGKANILVTTDETHDAVKAHVAAFEQKISESCSECSVDTMTTSTQTVTTAVPAEIVAYLRAHPEVEYVYAAYDPLAFFAIPAIQQAGMAEKVKVIGILGEAANLELIRKGEVQATDIAFDQHYSGWATIDQTLRELNGDPLSKPMGENVPWQLIDKENVPPPSKEGFRAEFNYPAEFRKVWGLSE